MRIKWHLIKKGKRIAKGIVKVRQYYKFKKNINNMKFCAKCGKHVDSTTCQYCGYHLDKTFISFKIRHSKKKFLFIFIVVISIIAFSSGLSWAIFDGHGPLYDRGNFVLHYDSASSQHNQEIRNIFVNTRFFDNIIDSYNQQYKLPHDIDIYFSECRDAQGQPIANAFYDPQFKEIVLCYELIDQYFINLEKYSTSDNDLIVKVQDSIYYIFVHELGHAFIDVYQLPLIGQEEDAADQLATIVLLQEGDSGINTLFSALEILTERIQDESTDVNELPYWDVHALDQQRYFNILCFIYATDTDQFVWIVEEDYLPLQRAYTCEQDFSKSYSSWRELLEPYIK